MSIAPAVAVPAVVPLAPHPRPVRVIPRVALADRVARAFVPLVCVRGFHYFDKKRIDLLLVEESAIDATVKGKRVQQVQLRIADGHLGASCTCVAKLLGPAACKHVWATLLEIDRRGELASLRTTTRALALGVIDDAPGQRPKRKAGAAGGAKPSPVSRRSNRMGMQPAPSGGAARGALRRG
jgi:hypothetical protein